MSQRSWVRYPVWPPTFVSPSADSRRAVVSYWQKYVHEVLVNHLGGLSLPRKSVVRLTDRPDMIIYVYRGRKTTTQQQQHENVLKDLEGNLSLVRYVILILSNKQSSLTKLSLHGKFSIRLLGGWKWGNSITDILI